jgi:hypothetical protein
MRVFLHRFRRNGIACTMSREEAGELSEFGAE